MNPEKQRIAIAEACGWNSIGMFNGNPKQPAGYPPGINQQPEGLPDYLNDLDAMHEAEKVFDDKPVDTKSLYYDWLLLTVLPEVILPGEDMFQREYATCRATAAQRAEAFLRTIGKWEE